MIQIIDRQPSSDGSTKYAFENERNHRFEAIEFTFDGIFERRQTKIHSICLSSQAGCALRCAFCATGMGGFFQDLSTEEMLEEVGLIQAELASSGKGCATSYALMGMGEPLQNLHNVIGFYESVREHDPSIGDISVSTVGQVRELNILAERTDISFKLFLSVHSPYEQERNRLIPMNQQNPLPMVLDAVRLYVQRKGRRAMANYLLLEGVNDDEQHALDLSRLLDDEHFDINILLMNEVPGIPFRRTGMDRAERFRQILLDQGLYASLQISRGRDVGGGCGQLVRDKRNGRIA